MNNKIGYVISDNGCFAHALDAPHNDKVVPISPIFRNLTDFYDWAHERNYTEHSNDKINEPFVLVRKNTN